MPTLVRIQPLPLEGKARYGGLFCVSGRIEVRTHGTAWGRGRTREKAAQKAAHLATRWRDIGKIRWRARELRGMRSCDNEHVTAVVRFVTVVDVRDVEADAHTMSISARHEAVLADGRRVLLLDVRGDRGRVER
jgi:hypothetical protein